MAYTRSLPGMAPKEEKAEIDRRVLAWQLKRANEGYAVSQYDLGMRYLNGDGVEQDHEKAKRWFAEAAQNGNNQAYERLRNYDFGLKRDANGKIVRSSSARAEFMTQSGYPRGRPGYVIDHIIPLKWM